MGSRPSGAGTGRSLARREFVRQVGDAAGMFVSAMEYRDGTARLPPGHLGVMPIDDDQRHQVFGARAAQPLPAITGMAFKRKAGCPAMIFVGQAYTLIERR